MAWVDFRKAYDMFPHGWIVKALKLIGAAPDVIAFLKSTMTGWKTELISGNINLGKMNIKIYFKDTLYHLYFSLYH